MAESTKNRVENNVPAVVTEQLTQFIINSDNDLTENIAYRVQNLRGMCHTLSRSDIERTTAQSINIIENELNVIQALLYGIKDDQEGES